jgi:iron complex transport system substrate-binding protein
MGQRQGRRTPLGRAALPTGFHLLWAKRGRGPWGSPGWARIFVAIAALMFAATSVGVAPASATKPPLETVSAAAVFPVSVHSGDGTVRIAAKPERILSLSASATQMLYAIGAGGQVVGVDKYSTYPAGAPRTKFTGYESSAEDYLYLKPDLVIFPFRTGTLIQQLQALHIPALLLPPATGMAGVDNQLTELGMATGHEAGARSAGSALASNLGAATRRVGNAGRGKTYYIEVDPTYYTATSKTFIGAEFSLFGMRDIADGAGHGSAYPQISPEYILKEDPDYVFLADTVCCHETAALFAKRPGFSALSAVRLDHVIGVNDSVASQWGPHTIEVFVAQLARVLRP